MFNEQEINIYKSVKAPSELKQKVLSSQKRSYRVNYKAKVLYIAACFILVFGLTVGGLLNGNGAEIYVNEALVERNSFVTISNPMAEARLRVASMPGLELKIKLKLERESEILVSDGAIDEEGNSKTRLKGEKELSWSIPMIDTTKEYSLSVKDGNKEILLKLTYDEKENVWKAFKEN